jgi:hypothetical protein
MKKILFFLACMLICFAVKAQTAKSQYLLIVRFKTDFKPATDTTISTNIKHWQAYMGMLGQSGAIAGGYRPSGNGATISGTQKTITNGPYVTNNDILSSVLVINADNMDAAKAIAAKCPALELGGSVEIRPMMDTAGK